MSQELRHLGDYHPPQATGKEANEATMMQLIPKTLLTKNIHTHIRNLWFKVSFKNQNLKKKKVSSKKKSFIIVTKKLGFLARFENVCL